MAERDRPPHEPPQEQGFLHRWSRRKAAARQVERQDVEREQPPAEAAPGSAQDTPPEAIDPASLPDIDSLTVGSDFKAFMRAGVPAELRRQALRKLWRLDPRLANLDGLLEYGEDYTQVGRAGTAAKTAYQVGKGFLEKLDEVEEVTAEDAKTAAAQVEAEADAEATGEPPAETPPGEDTAPAGEVPAVAPRRRTRPDRWGPPRRLPRRG